MISEPIEIHEHSPAWADEFRAIGVRLRRALGASALRIDHIGSTSIAGLGAKPIIDVQISLPSFDPIDELVARMDSAGYVWRNDNPELTSSSPCCFAAGADGRLTRARRPGYRRKSAPNPTNTGSGSSATPNSAATRSRSSRANATNSALLPPP